MTLKLVKTEGNKIKCTALCQNEYEEENLGKYIATLGIDQKEIASMEFQDVVEPASGEIVNLCPFCIQKLYEEKLKRKIITMTANEKKETAQNTLKEVKRVVNILENETSEDDLISAGLESINDDILDVLSSLFDIDRELTNAIADNKFEDDLADEINEAEEKEED